MLDLAYRSGTSDRWGLHLPFLQSSNFIRSLRSVGARLCWPTADRVGSHSFRWSAARALMSAGRTFAQLLRAGHWHRAAVRLHFDLEEGEWQSLTDILIGGSDDEHL